MAVYLISSAAYMYLVAVYLISGATYIYSVAVYLVSSANFSTCSQWLSQRYPVADYPDVTGKPGSSGDTQSSMLLLT